MISRLTKGTIAICTFLPLLTFAQDFVPLVGIPFMEQPEDATATAMLSAYANAFYIAAISLGAVVAVLKIIFAGVKYMLTDIVTDKSQAKTDIKGALLGLILIIGAVLILETISTDITSLRAFNLNALTIVAPEPQEVVAPIGSAVSSCDLTSAEIAQYTRACQGVVNRNLDAASGCTNISCDREEDYNAELSCSGNQCTCSYTDAVGPSSCVSECRERPRYQDRTISESTNTVTCTYLATEPTEPGEPTPACNIAIGCCESTNMSNCRAVNNPNVCRTEPNETGTCYFIRDN